MKIIKQQIADTPKSISKAEGIRFCIPVYQRLFAWDRDAVTCLINDLKKSFDEMREEKLESRPYYIGLITSTRNYELVDGQQRFSAMMLIGIVLRQYYKEWNEFLFAGDKPRLYFEAREQDNVYFSYLLNHPEYLQNTLLTGSPDEYGKGHQMIKDAIGAICDALNKRESFKSDDYIPFSKYVFENTSFFISTLPYSGTKELNKYFEAMNSTGRNLENHEILKVELLNEIVGDDKLKHGYALIWNAVADMDTPVVRKRKGEDAMSLVCRFNKAMIATQTPSQLNIIELFSENIGVSSINDLNVESLQKEDKDSGKNIMEIAESNEEPGKVRYESSAYRSMLRFTDFLLHVLYLDAQGVEKKMSDDDIVKKDFFESNNLSDTFKKNRCGMTAEYFIATLLKYRILYDYFVVRISSSDDKYLLYMRGEEDAQSTDDDREKKRCLVQFESFQYVFSSKKTYYKWLCPLLAFVSSSPNSVTFESLLTFLKNNDNGMKEHRMDLLNNADNFKYTTIDRYWFWRIDYYLWQERENEFSTDVPDYMAFNKDDWTSVRHCVDKYTFKRNRSIEHVAAQHPVTIEGKAVESDYEHLNDFGNLVMISSGMNSTLKNSTYEVKRGHIESCIKNKLLIESLAMFQIYNQNTDWTDERIADRTERMFVFLKKTYSL